MIRNLTAAALSSSFLFFASPSAFAQDANGPSATANVSASTGSSSSGPAHPVSIGILLGYGINNIAPSGASDSFNIYGFGIGVRAGYTLPFRLYLGGMFTYNLGFSRDTLVGSVTGRIMPLGVEAGYDLELELLTIRPYLGLGVGLAGGDLKLDASNGTTKFALWPGVLAMYNITDQLFVGLDLRYTIVTGVDTGPNGGSVNSFGFYVNGGYRF
jgi:hypothetical protein